MWYLLTGFSLAHVLQIHGSLYWGRYMPSPLLLPSAGRGSLCGWDTVSYTSSSDAGSFLYSSQSAVPCVTAAYICCGPLYGIHGAGMLPELKENPACLVPPFPFAGLLLRDNGNILNGIPLQFHTWLLHSIDYRFFAKYHK